MTLTQTAAPGSGLLSAALRTSMTMFRSWSGCAVPSLGAAGAARAVLGLLTRFPVPRTARQVPDPEHDQRAIVDADFRQGRSS